MCSHTETHMHSNTQHSSAHTYTQNIHVHVRACTHTCTHTYAQAGALFLACWCQMQGQCVFIPSHFTECFLEPRPLCPNRSPLLQTRRVPEERPSRPLLTASGVCHLSPERPRWQSQAHLPSCRIPSSRPSGLLLPSPRDSAANPSCMEVHRSLRFRHGGGAGAILGHHVCSLVLSLAGSPGSSMGK